MRCVAKVRDVLALMVIAVSAPAVAAAQSLTLQGLAGAPVAITTQELKALPHRTVTVAVHGLSGAYSGPPLAALLAKVDAPQGESLHGPAMSDIVVVRACDGYRVVLTLPDIDPAFLDQAVILADSVDGHPLDAHEGPFRLIVEGDKRAARSARCVVSLTLAAVP